MQDIAGFGNVDRLYVDPYTFEFFTQDFVDWPAYFPHASNHNDAASIHIPHLSFWILTLHKSALLARHHFFNEHARIQIPLGRFPVSG